MFSTRFESQYQRRVHTALPFAFNAEFLPILAVETVRTIKIRFLQYISNFTLNLV
jgi:hypothetical protein